MLQEEFLMSQLSSDKDGSCSSAQALMKLFAVSSHCNVLLQFCILTPSISCPVRTTDFIELWRLPRCYPPPSRYCPLCVSVCACVCIRLCLFPVCNTLSYMHFLFSCGALICWDTINIKITVLMCPIM